MAKMPWRVAEVPVGLGGGVGIRLLESEIIALTPREVQIRSDDNMHPESWFAKGNIWGDAGLGEGLRGFSLSLSKSDRKATSALICTPLPTKK